MTILRMKTIDKHLANKTTL